MGARNEVLGVSILSGCARHGRSAQGTSPTGIRVSADWGNRVTLVVPEEKGTYEFGCFIAGHYEAGMRGSIVVR